MILTISINGPRNSGKSTLKLLILKALKNSHFDLIKDSRINCTEVIVIENQFMGFPKEKGK